MKSIQHGYKSAISARGSSRIDVEKGASPTTMVETGADPCSLGESIGNVVTQHPTVNDVDYALGEAARTMRNEVKAITSLGDRDEAARRILGDDNSVLPDCDEPLDAEIALLISGIEQELAVMSMLADTLAVRLRAIAGERDRGSRRTGV